MIAAACTGPAGAPSLARDILAATDCLISDRVQSAYAALLAPGGSFAQLLTLALTIYVAIFSYRLILGLSSLTLAEVVPHFIKIGIILAMVTSWSTYQILVFDLLFHGPEQLANAIMRTASDTSIGSQADVLAALQSMFERITDYASDAWAQIGTVPQVTAPVAPPAFTGAVAPPVPPQIALPFQLGAMQFVAAALWVAALLMMAASVGVLMVVRIILALLLIIGPVFIACGLFSSSRGLFEGWLSTTVRFAIVPLFTLPMTAAMIAVLIPFVSALGEAPVATFRDGPTLAILAIVMVFAAVLFQVVRLAGGIAGGIRLPRANAAVPPVQSVAPVASIVSRTEQPDFAPSRADIIVQSLGGSRAGAAAANGTTSGVVQMTRLVSGMSALPIASIASGNRLGQSYRRLTVTTGAARQNRP